MKHKYIAKRYWNDAPTAMSGTKSTSINDLIDLTYGDPDFTTSEIILEPTFRDIRNGHTHYDELCGYTEVRAAAAKCFSDDSGIDITIAETYITNGAGHGLWIALESILDDGDEVIIQNPCYTPYPDQIKLARGIPVLLPTYESENFEINPQRLRQYITNRTKAIVVNNPNNPTGASFSRKALEDIAEVAKEYDLMVIADEVYSMMSYKEKFTPMASIPGMRERTITLCSASKEYAMTGWRVGYNIAPAFLIDQMKRVNENDSIMASSIAQRAMLHAMKNRDAVHKELYDAFKERVEYGYQRIKGLKNITVLEPKATFYLFVNIQKTGMTSAHVADEIYKQAHVAVFAGDAFGDCGEGYLRIACTQDLASIKEAFDRIEKMSLFS